jgi:hypothetical protein
VLAAGAGGPEEMPFQILVVQLSHNQQRPTHMKYVDGAIIPKL